MMLKYSLAALAAVYVCIAISATAATRTFDGGGDGSSWNDRFNWSNDSLPTASDWAVIPGNYTARVTGLTDVARGITVVATGNLIIENGGVLSLYTSSLDSRWTAQGIIYIETGGELIHDGDGLGFGGAGYIEIQGGTLSVASTSTLASVGTIRGWGIIRGLVDDEGNAGTFVNGNVVRATTLNGLAGPELVIDADTLVDDTDSASWSVGNCGTLRFATPALALEGDFGLGVDSGCLAFDESVATCGTWDAHVHVMVFAAGKSFSYANFTSASCSNPGTVTGTPSCVNPWILTLGFVCGGGPSCGD